MRPRKGCGTPVYFISIYRKKKIYVDMADDLLILWNQANEGLQAAESGRDMPMLNIAVCDDEVMFSGKLETMLLAIAEQEHMVADIDVFTGGAELVDAIYSGETSYDI